MCELFSAGRAPDAVVADFHAAARQDVLEESSDEVLGRQGDASHLTRAVVAVTETDHAVVEGLQAAVADGDAKDIAGKIVENLLAAAGMLAVNNPFFLPERGTDLGKQSRFLDTGTKFRTKDHRQRADWDEKTWFGIDPGSTIGGKSPGSDEHMDMRMEQHGARPGMENGQGTDARAKIAGVADKLLQGIGGSFDQKPVDFLRMGSCQGAEFRRKREG